MNLTLNSILKNLQKTITNLEKYVEQQTDLMAQEDEAVDKLQRSYAFRLNDVRKANTVRARIASLIGEDE
jgi:flagellar biosynthesis chaperone FliJ